MLIKVTNIICFLFNHDWLPSQGNYAICKRCKEIRVNVDKVATTLAQVVEGWKR